MYCNQCGAPVSGKSKLCKKCKEQRIIDVAEYEMVQPLKESKTIRWWIAAAISVLLFAFGAFLFFRNQNPERRLLRALLEKNMLSAGAVDERLREGKLLPQEVMDLIAGTIEQTQAQYEAGEVSYAEADEYLYQLDAMMRAFSSEAEKTRQELKLAEDSHLWFEKGKQALNDGDRTAAAVAFGHVAATDADYAEAQKNLLSLAPELKALEEERTVVLAKAQLEANKANWTGAMDCMMPLMEKYVDDAELQRIFDGYADKYVMITVAVAASFERVEEYDIALAKLAEAQARLPENPLLIEAVRSVEESAADD